MRVSEHQRPLRQVEAIALDPDAEGGIATIGSMDANNLAPTFSQTQATQGGSQVRFASNSCSCKNPSAIS